MKYKSIMKHTCATACYNDPQVIEAACINCNKRFTSMRAVSWHLKMTATRHTVNIIDHGDYDRNTGLTTEEDEST